MTGSLIRIEALCRRQWYLLRGSGPRLLELMYWSTVQMLLWGFMQQFLAGQTGYFAQAFGLLLAAILLWDVFFRSQLGLSLSFMEELWARNLGPLLITPLRPWELVAALLVMSLLRTVIALTPAVLLASWIFDFALWELGWPLAVFLANLFAAGWAVGLVVAGLVLRHGLGAESLAWMICFAIAPLAGVYFPVATLPDWIEPLAWSLPTAASFEGLRALMVTGEVRGGLMLQAAGLNLAWLGLAVAYFLGRIEWARREGKLLGGGE